MWDSGCHQPDGTWNAHLYKTLGDSQCVGLAGLRCVTLESDPPPSLPPPRPPSHTPTQHHSSISHPPLPRMPFLKCLSSSRMGVTVVGGEVGGARVSGVILKKAVVRIGWKWSMTLFSWNCSVVKTAWPLCGLPAVKRPFLHIPESPFNGTLLSALFFMGLISALSCWGKWIFL